MFLGNRIRTNKNFFPYAPRKAVWREAAPPAEGGADAATSGAGDGAGDPPADVADQVDYKALFEAEKAERERVQAESIQRKNKLKEYEEAQAKAEAEKQKAERAKLEEIDRIKLEKEDLAKDLSSKDEAISQKDKELFSARVELEAVRAGANNPKYIEFLVKEHLATLGDEDKPSFNLKAFVEGLKKTEAGAFAPPAPAKPANSGAGAEGGTTPPPAPDQKTGVPPRPKTAAEHQALTAGWASVGV